MMMLSRVADNLYWMSRYLERAEHTARFLDVYLNLMLDTSPGDVEHHQIDHLVQSLSPEIEARGLDDLLKKLTFDLNVPASITSSMTAARENAQHVREQISSEMWMQINKLYLQLKKVERDTTWQTLPHEFYVEVKEGSHLFQGITDATMNHNQGWQFIQLGRYIERIFGLLQMLDVHFHDTPLMLQKTISTDDYFELVAVLKSVTAYEAYTKVYNPNLQAMWVVEFLLYNNEFPRSLRFCVEMILASLSALADATGRSRNLRLYRIAGRLQSRLAYDEIGDILDLHEYLDTIREQIMLIHATLYDTFIAYPIETAL